MSDPLAQNAANASKQGQSASDRRSSERVSLSAIAEFIDLATKVHRTARVADISLGGCYVDTVNVCPIGARVRISILHSGVQLDAFGIVTFSHAGMGMGVNFTDLPPEMEGIIQGWISEIKGPSDQEFDHSDINLSLQGVPRREHHVLGRLIALMFRKGMLTREEASGLLSELRED